MKEKNLPPPTDAELEILQVIWQNGASTVKFVNEQIGQKREVGYTTTLKIMQIMFEKGILNRDESARTHIYTAKATQHNTRGQLLQNFVDNAFHGSAMSLVMQALGNHDATTDELDEIKKLINEIESKK